LCSNTFDIVVVDVVVVVSFDCCTD